MRPIDTVEMSKGINFDSYTTLFPAPVKGSLLPSQEVLVNPSVGFLPVPTRLDTAVDLVKDDEPEDGLQAMQVDYRVASVSASIETELETAATAARTAEAARSW